MKNEIHCVKAYYKKLKYITNIHRVFVMPRFLCDKTSYRDRDRANERVEGVDTGFVTPATIR